MTYGHFIFYFLVLPILILSVWSVRGKWQLKLLKLDAQRSYWTAILATSLIALIYTTLWDNYLVATKVWWYHPELIWGVLIGWVPLEEYLFFILQPILTGLLLVGWLSMWTRQKIDLLSLNVQTTDQHLALRQRNLGATALAVLWGISLVLLFQIPTGRYLGLLLVWALPPLWVQWWFGWRWLLEWRSALVSVVGMATVYLAVADQLAIRQGIWTINPQYSLGKIGALPIEEFLFFALTNVLIVSSVTLLVRYTNRQQ